MAIYSALRWRKRAASVSNLAGGPRVSANEDALLGWTPGQIIVYDYNPDNSGPIITKSSLRCIQWNIERGYRLDQVISTLQSHQADIICLQELDVHCARSDYRNAAKEIAAGLQMTCVFVVEFEEIFSRRRSKKTQGGGWHGNAILTRFPIKKAVAVKHTHHPIDWEREGELMGEPRRGERVTLCVTLDIGGQSLAVFSAHLEVFCGILGRIRQFKDILEYSYKLLEEQQIFNQLIFGDLNTMGHGVARFHPRFCRDSLRWRTMGSSEAAWWNRQLFSFTTEMGSQNIYLTRFRSLTQHDLQYLRNPYFYDPVPALHTTLRSVRGIFQGRLDWTLVRGLRTVDYGLDNHDYRTSDHKLLWVELEFVTMLGEEGIEIDPGPPIYAEQQVATALKTNFKRRTLWLFVFLVAMLAFTFGSLMSR